MDCEETPHQPKKIRVRPNKKTPFRAREIQSPRERKLFHEVLRLRKHNQVLQKKQARWKKRRNLEKQCKPKQTIRMQEGLKKMNRVQEEFLNMMHANNSIKSKGRRYSYFDKILSLSIYKQSPKCYRYLQSFLSLPSKSTLSSILTKMHIDTGITDETKQRLLEAAKLCTNDQEKVGILMWDEVSLGLGVHYDSSTNKVVGFEDWGTVRTEQYSDHALVFMLRLVKSGAKIPISFNFCSSMTNKMRPYPGRCTGRMPHDQRIFNYKLSRARRTIENTFGIMCSQWRIFRVPIHATEEHIHLIILAAVVLHNYLQKEEEDYPEDARHYCPTNFVDNFENGEEIEGEWRRDFQMNAFAPLPSVHVQRITALRIQNYLKDYFSNEGSVPWHDDMVNAGAF
ncbi:uncharacterized protein LOC127280426 [Leptopilina boulardi]|uniref:uncharacterized protein LOC127280426 n=1 Tax=Leptopilina boulardi TaxID=63433 RepID=UPI0021F5F8B2|nr:uncharacterized protein LOC127280426 [Leptopilina boulardi]